MMIQSVSFAGIEASTAYLTKGHCGRMAAISDKTQIIWVEVLDLKRIGKALDTISKDNFWQLVPAAPDSKGALP